MATRLPAAKPKPALQAALERHLQGERPSSPRVTLRVIKCSCQLSDRDNLYAGYKLLVDTLCRCGLIYNDDEKTLDLQVTQIKVAHRKEQGTFIRIELPD